MASTIKVDQIQSDSGNVSLTGNVTTSSSSIVDFGSGQFYKDTNGNVGIGTSSPAQKLSVAGNIAATGSIDCGTQFLGLSTDSAAAPSFSFTGDTDTGIFRTGTNTLGLTTGGTVRLTLSTTALVSTLPFDAPDGTAAQPAFTFSGDSNTGMFRPASDTIAFAEGGVEAMRITSTGSLLVGTTTNLGAGGISLAPFTSGFAVINNNSAAASGFVFQSFRRSSTEIGFIDQNGTTAVRYSTTSDYRLKEDVAPMTGALAKVAQLKPVTYKWKADGSDGEGFIAHEMQEICPAGVSGTKDAVDEEGNPRYQGIDTSFLVATLTAAIQEQQAIITALTARVESLEGAQE